MPEEALPCPCGTFLPYRGSRSMSAWRPRAVRACLRSARGWPLQELTTVLKHQLDLGVGTPTLELAGPREGSFDPLCSLFRGAAPAPPWPVGGASS